MNNSNYNSKISKKANASINRRAAIVSLQKKILIIAAVLVASVICIFGSTMITFASGETEKELVKNYISIEIQANDNLWTIAELNTADFDISVDDYINDVVSVNKLNSKELHAGQFIVIPEYHYEYKL